MPTAKRAPAMAFPGSRDLTLASTIHRIMVGLLPGSAASSPNILFEASGLIQRSRVSFSKAECGTEQQGRSDRHNFRATGWPVLQNRHVTLNIINVDFVSDRDGGVGGCVHPGISMHRV